MVVPSILSASLSSTRRLMAQYGSTAVCEGRTNRPTGDGRLTSLPLIAVYGSRQP